MCFIKVSFFSSFTACVLCVLVHFQLFLCVVGPPDCASRLCTGRSDKVALPSEIKEKHMSQAPVHGGTPVSQRMREKFLSSPAMMLVTCFRSVCLRRSKRKSRRRSKRKSQRKSKTEVQACIDIVAFNLDLLWGSVFTSVAFFGLCRGRVPSVRPSVRLSQTDGRADGRTDPTPAEPDKSHRSEK